MENLQKLKGTLDLNNSPIIKELLTIDFILIFSRFEFALKKTKRFLINGYAEPNWDKFASEIKEKFEPKINDEINKAVEYLLSSPPKILKNEENSLKWTNDNLDKNMPIANKLCIYIRRIRNNFFHGNKFTGDVDRNEDLIRAGIAILDNWVTLDDEVKDFFFQKI